MRIKEKVILLSLLRASTVPKGERVGDTDHPAPVASIVSFLSRILQTLTTLPIDNNFNQQIKIRGLDHDISARLHQWIEPRRNHRAARLRGLKTDECNHGSTTNLLLRGSRVGGGVVRIVPHSQFDIFGPLQTGINRTIPESFLRMVIGWPKGGRFCYQKCNFGG
jgi:hypothetical protein